jgi:hypothetical protein
VQGAQGLAGSGGGGGTGLSIAMAIIFGG